ncbi:hypothetical protein PCIT_a1637 [Pseudoalteromonas citrea]|uniref:Glycosyltransferase n=1 Tax=Pseudoalteromonas citrea TaxID=43655 RepID=A0AAD4AMM8_9GAMM|nr:hypothetical protein PCIT_a1637 [Pseudoalteromonas citrea]
MRKRVLILSGVNWDATFQRHHKVAEFFIDDGYDVDFVSGIKSTSLFTFKRWYSYLKAKFCTKPRSHSNPYPSSDFFEYKCFNIPHVTFLNDISAKILCRNMRYDNYDHIIVYVPCSFTKSVLSLVSTDHLVYDCVRNFSDWPNISKNVILNEKDLLCLANTILVDSYYLRDKLTREHHNVFQILPSVSDISLPKYECNPIRKTITKLAFFGTISSHFDMSILKVLESKSIELLFWGVDDLGIVDEYDFITAMGYESNETSLLESIMSNSDGIIIPYKGVMNGVIPAKIMQCLLTGMPVFISDFYDSRIMKDNLYIYKNPNELGHLLSSFSFENHECKSEYNVELAKENLDSKFNKKLRNSIT